MKIRIKGNSIRLRLSKSEVARFEQEGYVDERTEFGERAMIYALQQYDGAQLTAAYENDTITVLMPEAMAKEWTGTDKIGFEYTKELGNNSNLYLLVEKDFKCLDERMEDQDDSYDNPLLAKQ